MDANPGPEPWPDDELRRRAAAAEGLLAFMTDRVDAAFLAASSRPTTSWSGTLGRE